MGILKPALALAAALVLNAGCRKESGPPPPPMLPVIQLDPAFSYTIDSSCVDVPNVFTPNGDGLNDFLSIHLNSIATFQLMIYNSANQLVFTINSSHLQWNGYQNTSSGAGIINGRYSYNLAATTLSGHNIAASRYIYIVTNLSRQCFVTLPPALFNDMIDARFCGPTFATNENVCFE